MSKKKKTMAEILTTHDEVNKFAINRYHNDGRGFPISQFKIRGDRRRVIGSIFLVIAVIFLGLGVILAVTGTQNKAMIINAPGDVALFLIIGVGMLLIAWDNLRYRPRSKK